MPDTNSTETQTQPTTPPAAGHQEPPQAPEPNAGQSGSNAGSGTQPQSNTGDGKQDQERKTTDTFTKKQVDGMLAQARKSWQREMAATTDAARREAQRKAQEEAGEWETVASDLKAENTTLAQAKSQVERELERVRGLLTTVIEQRIQGWPPEVLALDPATTDPDNHTLEQRWAWVAQAEALRNVYQSSGSRAPGNPPSPPPGNGTGQKGGVPKPGTPEYDAYAQQVQSRMGFTL